VRIALRCRERDLDVWLGEGSHVAYVQAGPTAGDKGTGGRHGEGSEYRFRGKEKDDRPRAPKSDEPPRSESQGLTFLCRDGGPITRSVVIKFAGAARDNQPICLTTENGE
jgi:hypothetical protein